MKFMTLTEATNCKNQLVDELKKQIRVLEESCFPPDERIQQCQYELKCYFDSLD